MCMFTKIEVDIINVTEGSVLDFKSNENDWHTLQKQDSDIQFIINKVVDKYYTIWKYKNWEQGCVIVI